jgi:hypothetical protein
MAETNDPRLPGYQTPLHFRLVADGESWHVYTAVRPDRGMEVRFVGEPVDPDSGKAGVV